MYWGVSFAIIIMPFIFVISGWMITLCLHEFGHAFVAYHGGDREIAQTGYLTLDPLSYTHPVNSIIMPVIFVILGYIALPGGAVYVRTSSLNSPYWETAVSAAGPFMTLICLCVAVAPFAFDLHKEGGTPIFWYSLAALIGFIALSLVWNLLPIPGLDGWGIIEPFLPEQVQAACAPWRQMGPTLLVLAVVLVRPFAMMIWKTNFYVLSFMDMPQQYLYVSFRNIMPWNLY